MANGINTDDLKSLGRKIDPNYDLRERIRRLREKQQQQEAMPEQEAPEDRSDLYQLGSTLNKIATGSDALQPLANQLSQSDMQAREAALRERLMARQAKDKTESQIVEGEQQLFGRDQALERQGIEDERYESEQQRRDRLESKQDERYESEQQRQQRLDADNRKVQQNRLGILNNQLKDAKAIRDPNSAISKMMKNYYSSQGVENIDPNASAWDLQQLAPGLAAQMKNKLEKKEKEAKEEAKSKELTEAEKAVDREVGKDYAEYTTGGGAANTAANIAKLDDSIKMLSQGGLSGAIQGRMPSWLNPKATSVEEAVASVAQQSLKEVLGAQFTEKEAEQLIRRLYNPVLSEEENIKRLMVFRDTLIEAKKRKEEAFKYYEDNGTMKGYKGKPVTIEIFNNALGTPDTAESKKETKQNKDDDYVIIERPGSNGEMIRGRIKRKYLQRALDSGAKEVK